MFRSVLAQIPRPRLLAQPRVMAQRWYQIGPNSARPGMVIDLNGSPQIVVAKDHGGTGRGQAVIKLTLKHAVTGSKSQERFRGNDALEVMLLIQKEYQFLYADGNQAHLMDMQTFEELTMDMENFEGDKEKLAFLEDGMGVTVQVLEPQPGPISWRLPARHTYRVREVEMRLARDKGATYVWGTMDNGAKVMVPDFIKPGEDIIVDLLDKITYIGRA
ncbi:hypothetical protein LPJ66_000642 [Kickxella alabastrina]|uniref:Uncharacterized protein n=1 Tax=Kickxella alabastrina TaxID=61397 RepID=A0ACC1IVH8_9FUNG|nr:hypothetical protein LPJ66_000642 [Kickxella alabastrina]